MPSMTGIRFAVPSRAFRPFVTGYALLEGTAGAPAIDWLPPSLAFVSIRVAAAPIEFRTLEGRFETRETVTLHGPTTRAFRTHSTGGIVAVVGLTASGWMRATGMPAHRLCDRVVPLADVAGRSVASLLSEDFRDVGRVDGFAGILERVVPELLVHRDDRESDFAAMMEALADERSSTVGEVAVRLGLSPRELLRMSKAGFGTSPKLISRRARFLRAFSDMLLEDRDAADFAAAGTYHDASHFLRDANDFLGTTPRRFVAEGTGLLMKSLRSRIAALGEPFQALHL